MGSRDEARAFPQDLENADEAGVSHISHNPCQRPVGSDLIPYSTPSSMSPVSVFDVSGTYKVAEGRMRALGRSIQQLDHARQSEAFVSGIFAPP